MTNKQMDEKIRGAFEAATPNVLGPILAQCAKQKRNVTVFKSRRSTGWTARFITVTAAAILILVLTTGLIDRLPTILPTGPLFTGTDPTGTNPTQPDALTWVDWGMNATWVLKNGTTQGQYPMQIKGLIENRKETRLKLEIYTPDSFGYRFMAPDDGYSSNEHWGLVEQPGDYFVPVPTYSVKANKSVPTYWAISTTKEYFIAYWPENPGLFLVGAGDPSVSAAEVMAYFDAFVEEFRTEEPKPTDPDNKINVDWSMKALWVMANGDRRSTHSMTVKGTIVNQTNTTYLDLKIDVGQNFPYQFILPEPDGYAAGTRLVQAEGDYNTAGYVQDVATKETVWSAWAVSSEKEYFIFVLPDHPDKFLVGATDPNVTAKQILDYFDLFVDHYLLNLVDPPEPDILDSFPKDMNMDANTLAMFQVLFGDRSHYAQALLTSYDDPRDVDIPGLFEFGFSDESPVTDEERAEIVKLTGYEDYSWLDGYRLPINKMDAVLQNVFGLTLDDMNMVGGHLNYLESTNCYYRLGGGSWYVGKICIVGTKTLDNGNVEVYYTQGYKSDPAEHSERGVVTLKPVGDCYHILSNYYSEDGTWPGYQPSEPTEPEAGDNSAPMYFPEDMLTDADTVGKFQELLSCKHPEDNFFNMALLSVYTDPRKVDLEDLFYNGFYGQNDNPDSQEEADALKAHGWNVDEYDISRCPADEMNRVLTQLFGLTLADYAEEDLEAFVYLELTDCYYLCHSDSNCAHELQVVGYRMMENGDIEVFYMWDYWTDMNGVITLKPNGESYLILSNIFARAPK